MSSFPLHLRRPQGGAPRGYSLRRHQSNVAVLFVLPFLVVFLIFTAGPILISLAMGFTDARSTDLRNLFGVNGVGFENFADLFKTAGFIQAIANTLLFVIIGVPLTLTAGFSLALALNRGIRRLRGVYRAIFYAPVVTNTVAIAVIWRYAFGAEGPVNDALSAIGFAGPNWLGDSAFAMPIVILLGIWKNFGIAMVLFLAGLQTIPEDVYEAASLDGAGKKRQLFSITVPLLKPTFLLVSVLLTTFFLQVFDEPFLLTGGGPVGSTRSIALYTYEQFGFGNYGIASASSYVLVALVVIVSLVQFRMLRSRP